ncbi:MAG: DUF4097 family beta strand repeat protein [Planctomycetes bacterium]|nr:DUF4097 family beta strand repeat protein [Planctomycetota bacterium]
MRTRLSPRAAVSSLLITAIVTAIGCSGWQPARFQTTRQATIRAMAESAVDVQTANGSVQLTQTEQPDVVVDAVLKMVSQERADLVEISAEYQPDGTLAVRVLWPDGVRQPKESCSFVITLPDAVGVRVRTSNGSIELTGLSGTADLHTSNGAVKVYDFAGDVLARTSNGRVVVERAAGTIDVRTSNGRVTVVEAHKAVIVRTSNGRVRVGLADDGAGPVTIDTSNGSVEFDAGPGFVGRLTASTSNGSVHVDGSGLGDLTTRRRSASFAVGDSDAESRIKTSNGSITIRVSGG